MKRFLALTLALLASGCGGAQQDGAIYIQRFFGECGAAYGKATDVSAAKGECGIITSMINKFNAEHPNTPARTNVVAWPGYPQLSAQIAAGDPPDLVTMHGGVIADYAARGLLEPVEPYLKEAGLDPGQFTDASRLSVTVNGRLYGLPWDTHGGLYHYNTKLFEQAGLMRNGKPIVPRSAEELLAQARQFKARTGKPYLLQSLVADTAAQTRTVYTYLMAQGQAIFPDPLHIRLQTPEARRIVNFFRDLTREGLGTRDQDTPAAIAAFLSGEGGIYPTGTWMIGQFQQDSETPGRPLYNSYAVYPYPRLWGEEAEFVSGHAWVVPKRDRTPAQRAAIAAFFKFMAAHNYDWARTGHLPAMRAIIDGPEFRALPHRADIAPLAGFGHPLPGYVQRQNAIEGLVGEEISAAITGQKSTDQALADAERRVNELLAQLP
ncbi:MAG: extracellular solute-binding protein [Sphingomonadales bacterium]|nr:MAG: extracellular solute-binding protein [Sphingomonadales bacterium]